jgi:hypothetical protein
MQITALKPLQRQALLSAAESPTFIRGRGGFAVPRNGSPTFTLRLMRMLERDYLVEFDDPQFPSTATLTKPGQALATQLRGTEQAKAGAA